MKIFELDCDNLQDSYRKGDLLIRKNPIYFNIFSDIRNLHIEGNILSVVYYDSYWERLEKMFFNKNNNDLYIVRNY